MLSKAMMRFPFPMMQWALTACDLRKVSTTLKHWAMCNKSDGRPPYTVYPKSQSSKYFDGLDEVESGSDK